MFISANIDLTKVLYVEDIDQLKAMGHDGDAIIFEDMTGKYVYAEYTPCEECGKPAYVNGITIQSPEISEMMVSSIKIELDELYYNEYTDCSACIECCHKSAKDA